MCCECYFQQRKLCVELVGKVDFQTADINYCVLDNSCTRCCTLCTYFSILPRQLFGNESRRLEEWKDIRHWPASKLMVAQAVRKASCYLASHVSPWGQWLPLTLTVQTDAASSVAMTPTGMHMEQVMQSNLCKSWNKVCVADFATIKSDKLFLRHQRRSEIMRLIVL